MKRLAVLSSILIVLSPGVADAADTSGRRTINLIVYGDDPCPKSEGDEIVVCGHRPENERYRIPKELRKKEDRPSEVSWASRVAALEDAQRFTRPDSCSPVGTGGLTGCWQQMMRQWSAERRQAQSEAASIP
jgi:hypothetical protein